jgi:hypothetical protein
MSSRKPLPSNRSAERFDVIAILRAASPIAVALLGSFWIAGCDTPANQSDRQVQADVATAQAVLGSGDAASTAKARKMLEQAASVSDVEPLTRAYAKSSLAQVEQNVAAGQIRTIEYDNARLHQLAWEIGQLAQQVDASRTLGASYDKYDPKAAQAAIAADIAAAQGDADHLVWVKQDNSSIPSLFAVNQTIKQLGDQIDKQGQDLKSLQDQRTQVLDEADAADKSSEISKGSESVDDFKRAADLRKQAGDLTVQIDKNKAQTIPLQNDLAVAQGQKEKIEGLIKELKDQSQALDAGWKAVQAAVASQTDLQKQILAGGNSSPDNGSNATPAPAAGSASSLPPPIGPSINDKAEALGKLVQQISQERSEALSNLNSAIQHYRDAVSAGQTYFASIDPRIRDSANAQRPEMDAWKNLEDVANPAVYKMQEALAERQLAELYAMEVNNDATRSALQDEASKILGAVNLSVPPALSDSGLDEDRKSAATSASDAYAKAAAELKGLTSGMVPAPLPDLARVHLILTLYGQVQLARAMGDTSTANEKLTDTTTARDDAIQAGLQLPPLPPEIAVPSTPATPAAKPAA